MAGQYEFLEGSEPDTCGSPFCKLSGCRDDLEFRGPADPVIVWANAKKELGINGLVESDDPRRELITKKFKEMVAERVAGAIDVEQSVPTSTQPLQPDSSGSMP